MCFAVKVIYSMHNKGLSRPSCWERNNRGPLLNFDEICPSRYGWKGFSSFNTFYGGNKEGKFFFESDREYFHRNKTNLTHESCLDSEGSSHIRAGTCDWHPAMWSVLCQLVQYPIMTDDPLHLVLQGICLPSTSS